jgi:hypothetical protein
LRPIFTGKKVTCVLTNYATTSGMVGLGAESTNAQRQKKPRRVTQVPGDILEPVSIAVAQTLEAPSKFRLTCACTEVTPDDMKEVCKGLCMECQMFGDVALGDASPCCDECGAELTFYYVLQLTFVDATGSLVVRVCGEFAETLIGGGVPPPTDLRSNHIRFVPSRSRVHEERNEHALPSTAQPWFALLFSPASTTCERFVCTFIITVVEHDKSLAHTLTLTTL